MIEELFEMVNIFYNLSDSAGLKHVPIHIVSPIAKHALLLSNIYTEWMSKDRQLETMKANQPLIHGNLLNRNKIICHTSIAGLEKYPPPRLILTNFNSNVGFFKELSEQSDHRDDYLFLLSGNIL